MVVIAWELVLSRLVLRAAVVEAGAEVERNPLPVIFCVRQLSRACPGGFLPGQVSSGY